MSDNIFDLSKFRKDSNKKSPGEPELVSTEEMIQLLIQAVSTQRNDIKQMEAFCVEIAAQHKALEEVIIREGFVTSEKLELIKLDIIRRNSGE